MVAEAFAALVLVPLVAACLILLLPGRARWLAVMAGLLPMLPAMVVLTGELLREGPVRLAIAGFDAPLGIVWYLDALSAVLVWLNVGIMVVAGLHAATRYRIDNRDGQHFWLLWLLLASAMNALLLSSDLFNLFVTLELVTLASIGLLVIDRKPAALRAAVRYLVLALLGSLLYLLGVALIYGHTGTLDLYLVGQVREPDGLSRTALVLMTFGLLLKAAVFPLHGWLPAAHGNAPGPVSAILSALVVKVALYVVWRLWLWTGAEWDLPLALFTLGLLGAGAIVYGSLLAFMQQRLKMIIAYSTVAQLGYLMLLFPLLGGVAFQAATYHLLSHGLAKAAMFLAAANLLHRMGSDRLEHLRGVDRRAPLEVFTLALAGVSILGLPPSGGFIAKWLFVETALEQGQWLWIVVILLGGLLAAGYLFRALAVICTRPVDCDAPRPALAADHLAGLTALALALAALVVGLTPEPILGLLASGWPPEGGR
ncbi:proton-conducting membrane transporter [Halorhodospira sp. 9621]|uniref:complex I subunit 5 family protein n=1 Tax=Halorhodospira TaxID=85108 RepID=UPI001EE7F6FB|nr:MULTISPECIES: proton-conducting transporter membrane subunit [Halorhodospira]MCG5529058.1 proton-conducting membrane transporter [Halorhodospira halophila]MCG5534158.1 proton-conducting membrane transporter [Halorhodospira sp. 9621]MCG5543173.1 proton-conducting membrane transporter [Halorhodospira sp. 9628]